MSGDLLLVSCVMKDAARKFCSFVKSQGLTRELTTPIPPKTDRLSTFVVDVGVAVRVMPCFTSPV